MMKHGIESFTGVRPTAELTIANHIGAISPLLGEGHQDDVVFLADFHAATTEAPKNVVEHAKVLARSLIASEFEGDIYLQSSMGDLLGETELLLRNSTTIANVLRQPALKDKIRNSDNVETAPVGLAMYPIMMAADIVLVRPEVVPTGKDQLPHIEITRDIVQAFNRTHGAAIPLPQARIDGDPVNILSLRNDGRKMSKSEPSGAIFMNGDRDEARKKIKKATTASEPGALMDRAVNNLVEIGQTLSTDGELSKEIQEIGETAKAGEKTMGNLKEAVGEVVADFVALNHEKHASITDEQVVKVLEEGELRVRPIATETLDHLRSSYWG